MVGTHSRIGHECFESQFDTPFESQFDTPIKIQYNYNKFIQKGQPDYPRKLHSYYTQQQKSQEINHISCSKRKKTQTSEQTTVGPQALQHIHFAFSGKKGTKRKHKRNRYVSYFYARKVETRL